MKTVDMLIAAAGLLSDDQENREYDRGYDAGVLGMLGTLLGIEESGLETLELILRSIEVDPPETTEPDPVKIKITLGTCENDHPTHEGPHQLGKMSCIRWRPLRTDVDPAGEKHPYPAGTLVYVVKSLGSFWCGLSSVSAFVRYEALLNDPSVPNATVSSLDFCTKRDHRAWSEVEGEVRAYLDDCTTG